MIEINKADAALALATFRYRRAVFDQQHGETPDDDACAHDLYVVASLMSPLIHEAIWESMRSQAQATLDRLRESGAPVKQQHDAVRDLIEATLVRFTGALQ